MLRKRRKHHRPPPGSAPGTLSVHPEAREPEIDVISYRTADSGRIASAQTIESIDDLPPLPAGHNCWIDVKGLGNADVIARIGERFGLHPLVLGDIVNVAQRPKVEPYEDHLFIVTRIPRHVPPAGGPPPAAQADGAVAQTGAPWAQHADQLSTEQVTICIGADFVITFQEDPGDVFDPVRHRLRSGNGRLRSWSPGYLAYALLDAAIDAYFPLLEAYGERVEDLEQKVVERPEYGYIRDIHDLKRNLLTARRAVWPQREMLNALIRDDSPFIQDDTKVFLRDCYDHTIQLIDMIETYREIASGLVDIQLSSVSNRMNEVMKVLTIIATIFIPLTFISGVYGMNFNPAASRWNMPELNWAYGYPASLLVMALIAGGLLLWFRRKGWLRPQARNGR